MNPKRLALMFLLSFLAMYVTAYASVYAVDHLLFSLNKFYMAALMAGSMGLINVVVMNSMYKDRKILFTVLALSIVAVIVSLSFIRYQTFVGDKEFLGSMIAHHSAAILVCEEADLSDPDLQTLCDDIIKTQREEIGIMQAKLDEYD